MTKRTITIAEGDITVVIDMEGLTENEAHNLYMVTELNVQSLVYGRRRDNQFTVIDGGKEDDTHT